MVVVHLKEPQSGKHNSCMIATLRSDPIENAQYIVVLKWWCETAKNEAANAIDFILRNTQMISEIRHSFRCTRKFGKFPCFT